MNHRYLTALASVGGAPVLLPLLDQDEAALRAIHERLDGLFLAGGVDVDPSSYGAPHHESTGRTDPARDAVELRLTRWALEDGMPFMGVCRGMQILNVARGGTLVQDTTTLRPGSIKHDYFPTQGYARDFRAHPVTARSGSRLACAFGDAPVMVNSMHHQGIDALGERLAATGVAPDGLIEAVEQSGDAWVVGVQWHPEMLLDQDAGTARLFEAFIAAAAAYAQRIAHSAGI
jgi:putative glutamine amidotransferase